MEEIKAAKQRLKFYRDQLELDYQLEIRALEEAESRVLKRIESFDAKKKETADANGRSDATKDELLEINAGGNIIFARRSVLTQIEGSRLGAIFSGRWDNRLQRDNKGRIFLDVNATCFEAIVDYLNDRNISPPDHPPDPPSVDVENEEILARLLEIFGIHDIIMESQSKVTIDRNDWMVIRNWLKQEKSNGIMKLVYSSTLNGCSLATFQEKCRSIGPNIIIAKDAEGNIFGGYTSCSWWQTHADKAFLFALRGNYVVSPLKFDLKAGRQSHINTSSGPSFGSTGQYVNTDLRFNLNNSTFLFCIGANYEVPLMTNPFFTNGTYRNYSQLEVYEVLPSRGRADEKLFVFPQTALKITKFTPPINEAIQSRWQAMYNVDASQSNLEISFANEEEMIASFAAGENKDTVLLSLSGTDIAVKRSTLQFCEESTLARQFDDKIWKNQTGGKHTPIFKWTAKEVISWIDRNDDIDDEVVQRFRENVLKGAELLALGKEGLADLGIKRKGTIYLIINEIKKLEAKHESPVTFIEHSPYCFGKIVDYLRLKSAFCNGLISVDPPRPTVRQSEKQRFRRIVDYYFPGDSSKFIFG